MRRADRSVSLRCPRVPTDPVKFEYRCRLPVDGLQQRRGVGGVFAGCEASATKWRGGEWSRRGKTVTQAVAGDPLFNPGLFDGATDVATVDLFVQMMPATNSGLRIDRNSLRRKQPTKLRAESFLDRSEAMCPVGRGGGRSHHVKTMASAHRPSAFFLPGHRAGPRRAARSAGRHRGFFATALSARRFSDRCTSATR